MQAVILAGGKGSRLQPYTADTPKPLVKIGDKPIIEYLLHRLKENGVTEIHIAVNHKAEMIIDAIGDGSQFGLNIYYSKEEKSLSTVAPLKLIEKLDDNFIVANGDILTDLDFKALFDFHKANTTELTVAVHQRRNKIDYGVLTTDSGGFVTSFQEKPTHTYLVSMGIYIFSKSLLDIVPHDEKFGFDDLMYAMLKQGKAVNTYPFDGFWLDIGRAEDYMQAQDDIEDIRKLLE